MITGIQGSLHSGLDGPTCLYVAKEAQESEMELPSVLVRYIVVTSKISPSLQSAGPLESAVLYS